MPASRPLGRKQGVAGDGERSEATAGALLKFVLSSTRIVDVKPPRPDSGEGRSCAGPRSLAILVSQGRDCARRNGDSSRGGGRGCDGSATYKGSATTKPGAEPRQSAGRHLRCGGIVLVDGVAVCGHRDRGRRPWPRGLALMAS